MMKLFRIVIRVSRSSTKHAPPAQTKGVQTAWRHTTYLNHKRSAILAITGLTTARDAILTNVRCVVTGIVSSSTCAGRTSSEIKC